jgi:hypothetical protein
MVHEHELVPGARIAALEPSERLALGALRLIAAGRSSCPAVIRSFDDRLGCQGASALKGLTTVARLLPAESKRKLCLGWLCVRGVTWDEAAILGLLEAAQRSDAEGVTTWLERLGVDEASRELRKGLAWAVAGFVVTGKGFDPAVAHLTRIEISRAAQMRDQIETQIGPMGD